jgi:glutathione S-transferase
MPTLLGEYFSPWSEKARWALDHHGVEYTYREHVPLLGEPLLRVRARKLAGRVSVPLFLGDGAPIPDSLAIARHAERIGRGERLFPPEHEEAIVAWNARSEIALAAARALYLDRVAASRDAKVEMQPGFLPRVVRRASVPLTDVAIGFLRRKYDVDPADSATFERVLTGQLETLRRSLATGSGAHVVGDRFTYADVTMAATLQLIAPVADRYVPLGPATRTASHAPAIAGRFGDLVRWRDALYERWRTIG